MQNVEEIADALDALVVAVIQACQELENPPNGRLVLKAKGSQEWYVLFYFGSKDVQLKAVKDGDAYLVQRTFMAHQHTVAGAEIVHVFFEAEFPEQSGNWVRELVESCEERMARMLPGTGKPMEGSCLRCGHDSDAHQLRGWNDAELGVPKEGWIMCQDEDCACFGTWGLSKEFLGA
ncbi:MAG: hypothetical protein U0176_07995 [Bacteroidia bacterium]